METLAFVSDISWELFKQQHGRNNWVVELSFPLGRWPLRALRTWVLFSALRTASVRAFTDSQAGDYGDQFQKALNDLHHPRLPDYLGTLMDPRHQLPEGVFRLEGVGSLPHNHPVICVRPPRMRTLHIITTCTDLKQCHDLLAPLLRLRRIALLAQRASVLSLTPVDAIELPPRFRNLIREERDKTLMAHHPCFETYDPAGPAARLCRFRDVVPKQQALLPVLWALLWCAAYLGAAPGYQVPIAVGLVTAVLGFLASWIGCTVAVRQRVSLHPNLPVLR